MYVFFCDQQTRRSIPKNNGYVADWWSHHLARFILILTFALAAALGPALALDLALALAPGDAANAFALTFAFGMARSF